MSKIRSKVLRVILCTSLGTLVLLSIVWFISILNLRTTIFKYSDQIGEIAAQNSQSALAVQEQQQLMSLAKDKAALADEKLVAIQNQTKMVADMATHIYSYRDQYPPHRIDYLESSQRNTLIPHIRTAPGVSLAAIRDEVYRAANIADILRQINVVDIGVQASYIGGESGYFITVDKAASDVSATTYDVTTRNWYVGAKQKDGFFWTDIFTDSSGRGASIACSLPFYDVSNGNRVFKGVAGSGTTIKEAVEWIITSTKIGETGYAFLLNEKGQIILAPSDKDLIISEVNGFIGRDYLHSDNPDIRELARRMLDREQGIMTVEQNGQAMYVAYYPLAAINWSLGVVISIEEILKPAKRIQADILSTTNTRIAEINFRIVRIVFVVVVVICFAIGITVLVSHRLSNGLTAPLVALSEGALTLGTGNLNYRFDIKTDDEIEMLANTFNEMIGNITYITGEKERIGTELTIATQIQANMLPSVFPPFPDRSEFDVYAEMHPAKEVGGDFYDFFLLDENKLAIIIADVSGKGVPAAVFMGFAKTLIKVHTQMGKSLGEVFYLSNNQLCENNKMGMFVTVFMGILEINTGKFTYINAGHNPPLVRHGGGFTWLETKPGLVLAVMEEAPFKVMETTLAKGDMIFLYTDGVTEAHNTEKELFGNERLLEVMNESILHAGAIKDYTNNVLQAVQKFADGAEQADDITMLILERK